jgi:hypothetical protein
MSGYIRTETGAEAMAAFNELDAVRYAAIMDDGTGFFAFDGNIDMALDMLVLRDGLMEPIPEYPDTWPTKSSEAGCVQRFERFAIVSDLLARSLRWPVSNNTSPGGDADDGAPDRNGRVLRATRDLVAPDGQVDPAGASGVSGCRLDGGWQVVLPRPSSPARSCAASRATQASLGRLPDAVCGEGRQHLSWEVELFVSILRHRRPDLTEILRTGSVLPVPFHSARGVASGPVTRWPVRPKRVSGVDVKTSGCWCQWRDSFSS